MEFVLRIFFSGLIAFIPSSDGTELNVVLVNTPHEYHLANGTTLAHHRPLLLARAAGCAGPCRTSADASIAEYLFAGKTPEQAANALNGAIQSGAAWQLVGSELSLGGVTGPLELRTGVRGRDANGTPLRVPRTATEREDFTWIADISEVAPGTQGYKSILTQSGNPGDTIVAARLKLRNGKVMTYSVAKIDGKSRPVHFRRPSGELPEAQYSQALTNWVEAKIKLSGNSLEIIDRDFREPTRMRSMVLTPENGVIELALLNLPPYVIPAPDAPEPSPQPGQHFQVYYEFVNTPPAMADRFVPHQAFSPSPSDPQTDWASLHPKPQMWSNLLENLGLSPRGKSPYEVALCPVTRD